jgi:hypothetical protein
MRSPEDLDPEGVTFFAQLVARKINNMKMKFLVISAP